MSAITQYINGALEELRHVRWPTRQQAIRLSIIVIIFCAICSIAYGLVDYLLSEAVRLLLSLS